MKTKKNIIIISAILLLVAIAIVTGAILVNKNSANSKNDVSSIEDALKDINNPDTKYIADSYSDLGQDLTDNVNAPVTAKDKQDGLSLVNDAISKTDSTGVDQSGGFDINFGSL